MDTHILRPNHIDFHVACASKSDRVVDMSKHGTRTLEIDKRVIHCRRLKSVSMLARIDDCRRSTTNEWLMTNDESIDN